MNLGVIIKCVVIILLAVATSFPLKVLFICYMHSCACIAHGWRSETNLWNSLFPSRDQTPAIRFT